MALVKMMANPDAWCGPAQLREPTTTYDPHTPTPTPSDADTGEE
jgi:hypothetical protein